MRIFGVLIPSLQKLFNKSSDPGQNLEFGGLNPLLAKQLSELETQIGQFVQVQYQLSEERQRMRSEMDSLKKEVRNLTVPVSSVDEAIL